MERLYKPGREETRRMAIKETNTRYGRETCDEVERKIKLLNLVINFLFDLKRAVYK